MNKLKISPTVQKRQKQVGKLVPVRDNRKHKIEELKKKINNDDYIKEAINKLANSLTAGLMK